MVMDPAKLPAVEELFAPRAAGQTGSVIDSSTSLLDSQTHDIVRLAMGSPAAELVPTAVFADLLGEVAARGASTYDYGPTEGDWSLRAALMRLLSDHGSPCDPSELLITTGGMQGLDLVFKLFVGSGDLVAVESPTYTNGTATISGYEGRMVAVPGDSDGMSISALAELADREGAHPKVIYTIPTFQNPRGTTLSLERRRELIDLAEEWGSLIVEDDPYSLLRFAGENLPSLRDLAQGRVRVISVHTFSKVLAPGLRVGWLLAEPQVIQRMINARQAMDTCTGTVQQELIALFLDQGHMEGHLGNVRREYRSRKEAMHDALARELDGIDARWTDPQGGFFIWLTFPDSVDAQDLFPIALRSGVAYIPGAAFSIDGRFRNALRLAFSAEPPERAREGIRRLRQAIDHVQTSSSPKEFS